MHSNSGLYSTPKKKAMKRYFSFKSPMRKKEKSRATPLASTSQPELSPSSCYESIDELPLTRFITCLTTGELAPLIKEGTVPDEVLDSLWLHLYSDYLNRIGGVQISALIERSKQIQELSSKLNRLQVLINLAMRVASDEVAAAFKKEGFKLDPDAEKEAYEQQIRIIAAKLKPESMRLDRLLNEQPKADTKEEVTARSFNLALMDVSESVGYAVRVEGITTGEYCDHISRLRDKIEAQIAAQRNANQH